MRLLGASAGASQSTGPAAYERSTAGGRRAGASRVGGAGWEQRGALNGLELRPTASNGAQLHPPLPAAPRCRRSESVGRPVSPRSAPRFCTAVDKSLCCLLGECAQVTAVRSRWLTLPCNWEQIGGRLAKRSPRPKCSPAPDRDERFDLWRCGRAVRHDLPVEVEVVTGCCFGMAGADRRFSSLKATSVDVLQIGVQRYGWACWSPRRFRHLRHRSHGQRPDQPLQAGDLFGVPEEAPPRSARRRSGRSGVADRVAPGGRRGRSAALISHLHGLSRSRGLDAGERSRSVVAYLTRPVFVVASSATMRP